MALLWSGEEKLARLVDFLAVIGVKMVLPNHTY